MKVRVKVPKLGLTIEDVTLATWEKSVGDRVAANEIIATVEADKANYEIISPVSGVLVEQSAEEDTTITVGGLVGIIESD